ncbi:MULTISPECIES: ATP-binding protein [Pectobacterium]|uniref:ATP-binding protein n=1 Tax=Pectobacterium TaxID=122277 RepID=UPI00069ACC83|nr:MULTISPECIES: ATP-binding protein [Pectobacterium]MCG5047478.1 ATP-binding protein [Pectobacterium brasiliense]
MNNNKEYVNFNVSARTARLIGRENVATSDGAIIELVKNTYDADSEFCIVYFDIPYSTPPELIKEEKFSELSSHALSMNLDLHDFYIQNKITFEWERCKNTSSPSGISSDEIERLKKEKSVENEILRGFFSSLTNIYIIDNGEGMSSETIKKNWMTIGTDNKNYDIKSKRGRTKSGAKGIGRFALDRLGRLCTLKTITEKENGVTWKVDWDSFEQNGKNINEIYATIESFDINENINPLSILGVEIVEKIKSGLKKRKNPLTLEQTLTTGTIIKIASVRDHWSELAIKNLKDRLESLVPPSEDTSFQLFLFCSNTKKYNGLLQPEVCEDYDYKLEINLDGNLNLTGRIIRNEFRTEDIPPAFFQSNDTRKLKEKIIPLDFPLSDLMPGISDMELSKTGPFSFILYFMKRAIPNKSDTEKYYQKKINTNNRSLWLDSYGGIKLFRDNFRVRPYGERGSSSWDWLELGNRVALNPAQVSRHRHWKVSPNNITGVINISRIDNPYLEDKSSREGVQENDSFLFFKNIIEKLIKIFEDDRSFYFSELLKFNQKSLKLPSEDEISKRDIEKATQIANEIYQNYKNKNDGSKRKSKKTDDETIATVYLKEKEEKEGLAKELTEMREENSLLRVFASSGVTIASFTHELENLQIKLGSRFDEIKKLISPLIDEASFSGVYKYDNPYYRLELFEKEDKKLKQWLQYTLRTIRKDKRNQQYINIADYLENFKTEWSDTLDERCVNLALQNKSTDYQLKSFEIDLDCIFNNLLINSLDAFIRNEVSSKFRNIEISTEKLPDGFHIKYEDSGPGLSKDITNAQDIFRATFTTKRDKYGKEIGTGMGMWLVKKSLEQYNATCTILSGTSGFSIEITFP